MKTPSKQLRIVESKNSMYIAKLNWKLATTGNQAHKRMFDRTEAKFAFNVQIKHGDNSVRVISYVQRDRKSNKLLVSTRSDYWIKD